MKHDVRGAHWRLATPRTSTAQHSGVLGRVPVQTSCDPLRLLTTGPAMTAEAPRSAAMVVEKSIVIIERGLWTLRNWKVGIDLCLGNVLELVERMMIVMRIRWEFVGSYRHLLKGIRFFHMARRMDIGDSVAVSELTRRADVTYAWTYAW